jgi:hypothetical protein
MASTQLSREEFDEFLEAVGRVTDDNPVDVAVSVLPADCFLPAETKSLSPLAAEELRRWCSRYETSLGRAGAREFRARLTRGLIWLDDHYQSQRGSFRYFSMPLLSRVETDFFAECGGRRACAEERRDDLARDAARRSDAELERYLGRVEHYLKRRQAAGLLRRVPGYTADELREEIMLELRACMRSRAEDFARFERPGRRGTVVFVESHCRRLRAHRRIFAAVPLEDVVDNADMLAERVPTPIELLVDAEREQRMVKIVERARAKLSRCQRGWFEAIAVDVAAHGQLNLARVARMLGDRDRSNAQRALKKIRAVLKAAGAQDVLREE